MKCVILAGGNDTNLESNSGKNVPKQFLDIKEGRSLLQETVVRNMPFCDEFIIVTKDSYKNIVNGQMKAFQSLEYRIILEGRSKRTATILLGSMFCNESELVFVVTADNLIEGFEYKNAILSAKKLAKEGYIVALGIKPEHTNSSYGYILRDQQDVLKFVEKIPQTENAEYSYKNGYLWNSGMFIYRAADMLKVANELAPELYHVCRDAKAKAVVSKEEINFSENVMNDIPEGSIEQLVFEKKSTAKIVEAVQENDKGKNHSDVSAENNYVQSVNSTIVKLDPAFKDNLWGGTKLRTVFGKKCDYDVIGESWELSAHPDGQSRIAEGQYKGMLFNDYLSIIGKEAFGWKCQAQDRFPVLIKFIDAKQALSIQIHPDDEYALENEGEYGKNEMWYVIDCEPDSYLYCGLSREVSKKELQQRIENNTITEVLNRIDVKPGDVVMVKAGTIHAIGAGIMICEIQQNSNSTYRMYDYDRRDKFGNPRELHVEKALDVVNTSCYVKDNNSEVMLEKNDSYILERLVQCKYFECFKYEIFEEVKILVDEASFVSVLFIDGEGTIRTDDYEDEMPFAAGESFFISAGKRSIIIKGKGSCIMTHV